MRLRKLRGDKVWFTSDYHLSHNNILKYDNRPFDSVADMNNTIIENHNKLVKRDDIVFFLGDFTLNRDASEIDSLLNDMNGQFVLIKGNHDSQSLLDSVTKAMYKTNYMEIKVVDNDAHRGKQHIVLCHYPLHEWNKCHYGTWMIHGHCHGNNHYDHRFKILDVGINTNDYKPYSYHQVKDIMDKRVNKVHH